MSEAEILFKRDNAHLLEKPSLDRIDPDGSYVFDNCRFIELIENIKRRRPNGSIVAVETKEEEWTD
jgi:hypothetical protein